MREHEHDHPDHVHGPHCNHDHHHHHQEPIRARKVPGRNEPCWCGSERKYKTCHWKADRAARS